MALRMLRLELHQIADLPRMKANIRARRNASSGASDSLCRSKDPASDSVCAWLMSGPGMFMGMRCYQQIQAQLLIADLLPLRYPVRVMFTLLHPKEIQRHQTADLAFLPAISTLMHDTYRTIYCSTQAQVVWKSLSQASLTLSSRHRQRNLIL
jgi:hypothetical protein